MKKFRFALLALGVAAMAFAFTPSPSTKKAPTASVYAFDSSGLLIDSAGSRDELKSRLCPGPDETFCAEVWTSKTINGEPAGTQLQDLKKPGMR